MTELIIRRTREKQKSFFLIQFNTYLYFLNHFLCSNKGGVRKKDWELFFLLLVQKGDPPKGTSINDVSII